MASWTARALANELPATDRTGQVRVTPTSDRITVEDRAERLDILAERVTVGPSRRSYTIADLQRAAIAERS